MLLVSLFKDQQVVVSSTSSVTVVCNDDKFPQQNEESPHLLHLLTELLQLFTVHLSVQHNRCIHSYLYIHCLSFKQLYMIQ